MTIGKFFTAIKDGAWHNIDELSEQLQLQKDKLKEFAKFLHKQGVVKYEEANNRIKIEPTWQAILPEEDEELNRKPTVARRHQSSPLKPA